MKPMVIVHGGAGDAPEYLFQSKLDGVKIALRLAYECLLNGGSALDAVELAIATMESDVNLNAGYGSVLNIQGEVEMDASIMRGSDLNTGAVTIVKEFLHPIRIARKVLMDSPYSFIGGEGVKLFAIEKGFQPVPPETLVTKSAKQSLKNFFEHGDVDETDRGAPVKGDEGTVGAVAVDADGHVAAGTSTGGKIGKPVGRIADTSQIGSGTYADDNVGAVSSTGHGESIMKYCLSHTIIKLMENGMDANTATTTAVNDLTHRLNNVAGAITLSKSGEIGLHFTARSMSWAYVKDNIIYHGIQQGQVLKEEYNKEDEED